MPTRATNQQPLKETHNLDTIVEMAGFAGRSLAEAAAAAAAAAAHRSPTTLARRAFAVAGGINPEILKRPRPAIQNDFENLSQVGKGRVRLAARRSLAR